MIISANSFNQLIFIMANCCVFYEVQTEFLNIIHMSYGFKGINLETERIIK
jgi:hypothetical protein